MDGGHVSLSSFPPGALSLRHHRVCAACLVQIDRSRGQGAKTIPTRASPLVPLLQPQHVMFSDAQPWEVSPGRVPQLPWHC